MRLAALCTTTRSTNDKSTSLRTSCPALATAPDASDHSSAPIVASETKAPSARLPHRKNIFSALNLLITLQINHTYQCRIQFVFSSRTVEQPRLPGAVSGTKRY